MYKSSCLFLIITFSVFISCQKEKQKETVKEESWESIELSTNSQIVTIYKYEDTANSVETIYKKVSTKDFPNLYRFDREERKVFKMSKSERDSLYKYTFKLLTKPTFTDRAVTDYVGNITIRLKDRNTKLICEYESVGEWSTISPETKKIYELVNSKVAFPK